MVKESWLPEPVAPGQVLTVHGYGQSAHVGGEQVQPGRFMGLFVMLRARAGEASDAGWLYATVSPQGEVTLRGSCPRAWVATRARESRALGPAARFASRRRTYGYPSNQGRRGGRRF